MLTTFYSFSYHCLCKVSDWTPGVAIVVAGDVAETCYIFPSHQLVGLRRVAQNSNEEQKDRTGKLIMNGTGVHRPVAGQESSSQNVHVLPLGHKSNSLTILNVNNTHVLQQYRRKNTDLYIIPVESAFSHDQQVSLRVRGAESLLTESQKGFGTRQIKQRRDPVCHTI